MIEWYVSVFIGRVEHILLEICPMDASRTLLGPAATCLLCECGRSSHERDLWFHGWSVSYFSLNSVALFLELGMFPANCWETLFTKIMNESICYFKAQTYNAWQTNISAWLHYFAACHFQMYSSAQQLEWSLWFRLIGMQLVFP